MSLGVLTINLLLLAVAGAWALRRATGGESTVAAAAPVLRWVAFGVAVILAVRWWETVDSDSPGFAGVALGVPVVGTALPAFFSAVRPVAVVLTWVGALGLTVWAVLLSLGLNLVLLPPALLLLGAAVVQNAHRDTTSPS